jgi:hypothetical protein
LAILISLPPALRADYRDAPVISTDAPVTTQSLWVASDYSGVLYLDGKKAAYLKAKHNFFEIRGLPLGTHLLAWGKDQRVLGELELRPGRDAYAHIAGVAMLVGDAPEQVNYKEPGHPLWPYLLGLGVAATVGLLGAVIYSIAHMDWRHVLG